MRDELYDLVGLRVTPHLVHRMVARVNPSVAIAHTPEGISVFGVDIQRDDVSFEFNHGGWSNVSGTEELRMLTEMAFESHAKSYWFDPNEDLAERLARDIARVTGGSSDLVAGEIRNLMSLDTYTIHCRDMKDLIKEIAFKSIEMPSIKEVPCYVDLQRKKKKNVGFSSIVKNRKPINNPIQGRCY